MTYQEFLKMCQQFHPGNENSEVDFSWIICYVAGHLKVPSKEIADMANKTTKDVECWMLGYNLPFPAVQYYLVRAIRTRFEFNPKDS